MILVTPQAVVPATNQMIDWIVDLFLPSSFLLIKASTANPIMKKLTLIQRNKSNLDSPFFLNYLSNSIGKELLAQLQNNSIVEVILSGTDLNDLNSLHTPYNVPQTPIIIRNRV